MLTASRYYYAAVDLLLLLPPCGYIKSIHRRAAAASNRQ